MLSKISVTNYQVTLHNIPQYQTPELYCSESLKSHRTREIYQISFCRVKLMYIISKEGKNWVLHSSEIQCCITVWLKQNISGEHGGLIVWGRNWTCSILNMGPPCCLKKVRHRSSHDAVPHPRRLETSTELLQKPEN